MNKSKTPLFLTEALMMLLVFSLVAAVCMRIFAAAREECRQSRDLSRAARWAGAAADCYQASGGDVAETCRLLGAREEAGGLQLGFDRSWEPGGEEYLLTLTPEAGRAEIAVTRAGEVLFTLETKAVTGLG